MPKQAELMQHLQEQKRMLEELIRDLTDKKSFSVRDYQKYDRVTLEVERNLRKVKSRKAFSEMSV